MKSLPCFVFLGLFGACLGAKILTVVPTHARSHYHLIERLTVELANRGHDVTILSSIKSEKSKPNFKEIILPDNYEQLKGKKKF